jgi:hypothetical protein
VEVTKVVIAGVDISILVKDVLVVDALCIIELYPQHTQPDSAAQRHLKGLQKIKT